MCAREAFLKPRTIRLPYSRLFGLSLRLVVPRAQYSVFSNCSTMVTVSPSGPRKLFKGVTTATSGVLARFPWLLPVRNPVAGYGASAVTRTPNVKKKFFFRRSKRQRNFCLFFLLHKRVKPAPPPLSIPPPIHLQRRQTNKPKAY